jgi:hypothetical protein
MTLGNVRERDVHHLIIGYCRNDACPTIRGAPSAELQLASEREPHQQGSQ